MDGWMDAFNIRCTFNIRYTFTQVDFYLSGIYRADHHLFEYIFILPQVGVLFFSISLLICLLLYYFEIHLPFCPRLFAQHHPQRHCELC